MKSKLLYSIGLTSLLLGACGGEAIVDKPKIEKEIVDPNSALNTDFEGKIFSIPSPMQTAILIEQVNAPFNEALLNSIESSKLYSTEYQKALNLGIYGTDLGYLSIYKKNATALKYLSTIEKLTNDLGLEGAFDPNFLKRFENNSTNKDSMMSIVSDAFKNSDSYLKANKRKNVSALILVGGWIESLYMACEINKTKSDKKIMDRIGEQKETLNTIVEILEFYNKNKAYDGLILDMQELKSIFELIQIRYDFVQPKTDAANKLTTIKHGTDINIPGPTMEIIYQKINKIRNKIIQ